MSVCQWCQCQKQFKDRVLPWLRKERTNAFPSAQLHETLSGVKERIRKERVTKYRRKWSPGAWLKTLANRKQRLPLGPHPWRGPSSTAQEGRKPLSTQQHKPTGSYFYRVLSGLQESLLILRQNAYQNSNRHCPCWQEQEFWLKWTAQQRHLYTITSVLKMLWILPLCSSPF